MTRTNAHTSFLLWMHVGSVAAICVLVGLAFNFAEPTTNMQNSAAILTAKIRVAIAIGGAIGVVTGFGFMATRSGRSESLAVAASTILAFCTLMFAM
jgi:hypothetical protein